MDQDFIVILASAAGGGWLWLRWYQAFYDYRGERKALFSRLFYALQFVPIACLALTWVVLSFWAASDVRDNLFYLLEYILIGFAWLAVAELGFQYLGVGVRQDMIDRRNPAAFGPLAGALVGVNFCYIGSNIGEGPGYYVVFFCAGLATLCFFVVWWLYALLTQIDYTVTVDRDLAAGVRLGGFLAALGLILGRAAAGNWISYGATLADMAAYGLPAALVLLATAIGIEYFAHPTPEQPSMPLSYGFGPLALYILLAVAYVVVVRFPA